MIAEDSHGICGTVQLIFDLPENQPHRADLAKMLVHRRVRRQGLGEALMRAAETTARECRKTLLVLDTVTGGDAERQRGTEREADVALRVEPHVADHLRVDLAGARDFQPAAGQRPAGELHVDLGAGLGEREVARPEPGLRPRPPGSGT